MLRIVYLHGFASGPQSSKAQFFKRKFADISVPLDIPQLDAGDFERLTITGQLAVIDQAIGGEPVALMGSSLGGYLAALYVARHPEVEKLVLLAPAFQFPKRLRERYTPEELSRWRREGAAPVVHYAYQEQRMLGYGLMEDSERYEGEPDFSQPAIIFHGKRDEVVPPESSEHFATGHGNVTLHLFDSGHELTDVLEPMWELTRPFLSDPS